MLLVASSVKFRYKVCFLYCPKPVCDWFTWWLTKTSLATIPSNQKLEQLTRLVRMRFPAFGRVYKLDIGRQMPWLWEGPGNFKTVIRGVRCEGISVCFQGKPKYLSIFVRLRSCSVCWLKQNSFIFPHNNFVFVEKNPRDVKANGWNGSTSSCSAGRCVYRFTLYFETVFCYGRYVNRPQLIIFWIPPVFFRGYSRSIIQL